MGQKKMASSRGNEVRAATKIANARRGQLARRQVAQMHRYRQKRSGERGYSGDIMEGWGPENVRALHNPDPFSR